MTSRVARFAAHTAALALLLGITACGSGAEPPDDDGITVVASTDVWANVVRAVAGDDVEIVTIIDDPGADPHSYEASPADAAAVHDADLVVYNGGGYDPFMEQFLAQSGERPAIEAFSVAEKELGQGGDAPDEASGPRDEAHRDGGHEHGGHEHGPGTNEHVWYDLHVVQDVARRVAEELGRLDAGQAQRFGEAASAFSADLDELSIRLAEIAGAHRGEQVVMTEPVAYHLVLAAGLTDVTPPEFAQAIEEETDPPAAAVVATANLISGGTVRVLIHNPQTETPVTSEVRRTAQTADVPVVTMTETLPEGSDYTGWMSAQIDQLAAALRR